VATSYTLFPNDFNIGKDATGRLFDDQGNSRNLAQIGHVLSMGVELHETVVRSKPISNGGLVLYETIWEGCELHFRFTRARGNVEFIAMQAMANFFALDLRPNFAFLWNVLNRDGSIDKFQASGLKLQRPNLGTFSAEKDVEQELRFVGQTAQWTGPNQPPLGASPLSF